MNNKTTIELTQDELRTIVNMMEDGLGGAQPIEEWEFHTLIGATKDEAKLLHNKLLTEYREKFPPAPQT